MTYEDGLAHLEALVAWAAEHEGDRNEATTRLHLIDQLLIDCLGWPRHNVEAERHFLDEYTDYELGAPAKQLLLEAKREGRYLELPIGFGQHTCRLQTLGELSKDIGAAIDQAMRYAQTRGIPVAAVSNGNQLIAFVASRQDGLPPTLGDALVYESLPDMRSRFAELWNALSPAGVAARHIFKVLTAQRAEAPPDKLSRRLLTYPGYKNRNPIAAELQILGGLFLEDITRMSDVEEGFVRDTYCESGALSQYAMVSREILGTRYSHYFEKETRITISPARTKKGVEPELRQDLLAAAVSQRPILLLGDVGVGKSMFIKHLVYVDARAELSRAIVLYVDFGSKPAITKDLPPYVLGEFERQLRQGYEIDVEERNFVRGVYNLELKRFETGVYADLRQAAPEEYKKKELERLTELMHDKERHLQACLGHVVKGQNRQVVIFLDNVDQRPLEFQEEVFLMGQAFAQTWPVTVFIALRPDTFALSRSSGSLSGYQPRVFTIDPPRVDKVLQKRLDFALKELRGHGRLPTFPEGLRLTSGRLEQYIQMLAFAFETSEEIVAFIDNMSNGNLRTALGYVATFVGSAHVDTAKIFQAIEQQGRYNLPLHEFLRAVLMQDNEHYDPADSPLLNAFDILLADPREHFLILVLLSHVERTGSIGGAEGFVSMADIYSYLQSRGFVPQQVEAALQRCGKKGLLAAPRVRLADEPERLRITTAGAYTTKRLVRMFAYADAMIVDTPILATGVRGAIDDERTIEGRLARTRRFVAYLDSCWDPTLVGDFDWPASAAALRADMDRIERRRS